ncbi:MAG: hypothetical protein AAFW87_00170 [Pseudomonadota bacterium]
MADQNNSDTASRSNNAGLAFIVGALVVAVCVLGYMVLGNGNAGDGDVTISIEGATDAVESAAAAAEGASEQ